MKTVAMFGTLDTKGEEFLYLKQQIEKYGVKTLVVDAGVMKDPIFKPDITASEVAKAGGGELSEMRISNDAAGCIGIMQKGIDVIAGQLLEQKRIDAAISMGGGQGSSIGTIVFRKLPIGMPKIMISTMAMMGARLFSGTNDTYLTSSIVDIAGLNSIMKTVLNNAAGAIAGMAKVEREEEPVGKKRLAATMFGITTKCVEELKRILEDNGYEFFAFHGNGIGGPQMEGYIKEGYFDGVIDITTSEVSQQLLGGACVGGPERMEVAGRLGVAQVVVPGAVDDFMPINIEESKAKGRKIHQHNPTAIIARTTVEDNIAVGKYFAEKLNKSKGKTALVLPLRGVSEYDKEGMFFFDPEADKALFDSIRANIDLNVVDLVEMDCHINDPVFAQKLAELIMEMVPNK